MKIRKIAQYAGLASTIRARERFTASRAGLASIRDYGIIIAFGAIFLTLSVASDVFLTWQNLLNILDQNAAVGVIAVAATLVFIAGGFDLSVGSIYAVAGIVAAELAPHVGSGGAILVAILLGAGFGIVNGVLTSIGRMNAFIATLATSIIIGGIAIVITNTLVIVTVSSFSILGQGAVGLVKYTVFVWLGFTVLCALLLHRTILGRYIFACGGNPEAARLSGIRVGGVRGICYVISGLAGGLAGVLDASRVSTAQPGSGGLSLVVLAIAAVVIGGTSIQGGEGAIWRTIVGVLLLALIGNGFNLLNIDPVYQDIFRGCIILGAVAVDGWSRRGSR